MIDLTEEIYFPTKVPVDDVILAAKQRTPFKGAPEAKGHERVPVKFKGTEFSGCALVRRKNSDSGIQFMLIGTKDDYREYILSGNIWRPYAMGGSGLLIPRGLSRRY